MWANAVLKDSKILFWWTGEQRGSVYDFHKDFYYAGLDMMQELENHQYQLVQEQVADINDDAQFYRQFPIHEEFVGNRPY